MVQKMGRETGEPSFSKKTVSRSNLKEVFPKINTKPDERLLHGVNSASRKPMETRNEFKK